MKRLLVFVVLLAGLACRGPAVLAPDLAPGVSRSLADHRAATLAEVRYELSFTVPAARDEPVRGRLLLSIVRRAGAGPLVLDFVDPGERVLAVTGDGGAALVHRFAADHVVIDDAALAEGENRIAVEFVAGDGSLNRQDDFLYTLFVPDRARLAFPCFDQPNLKARFRLGLELPAAWRAVSNGASRGHLESSGRTTWTFAETEPLPTYLFAFAAGRFEVEEAEKDGRRLRFLHRETDADKVARNKDALFDLHARSLAWLEDYTGLDYPFPKLDFVLVPGFQYGGMEHPGAVLYRDARLLLDASATQDDHLRRASLIAHETAHMWFGDLVTMPWFDDVWMKEVFANFMAAKVVHPSFPEVDHDLRFLLAHHPAAYAVDRSAGANPIRQELGNLAEAGTLYGAIIYQKAPIVMRQLEALVGEETLRRGLGLYLERHRWGNAGWPDLVAILDELAPQDLASWSRVWVGEAGRPEVAASLEVAEGRVASLGLVQSDPAARGRLWPQRLEVALGTGGGVERFEVDLVETSAEVTAARGLEAPAWVLPGSAGLGYGRFLLDEASRLRLAAEVPSLETPLLRGAAWLALWEEMLDGRLEPTALYAAARAQLEVEDEALLVERLLGDLPRLWWRFLPEDERSEWAAAHEAFLWRGLEPENRRPEPWVLDAVAYLHHPLRAAESQAYVLPSLELLEEVQRTGDIFFPKRWLDATLDGHRSPSAAAIVRDFLAAHPDLPPRLRGKLLQSADGLFRAADLGGGGS